MSALGKQIAKQAAPDNAELERAIKLKRDLVAEHESHERYTDVCKFCIYSASFVAQRHEDDEDIALAYLREISLSVVNAAIADVDFALDMRGMVKPFVAGELAA